MEVNKNVVCLRENLPPPPPPILVSVIIPIYNVAPYLTTCLDSVLQQTYPHLEIICIEDKSTDNSYEMVQAYARKDERIRLVQHEHNKGLGPSRNTGLDIAKGDYIFFVDSDDYISLNAIETLLNLSLSSDTEVSLGGFSQFEKENTLLLYRACFDMRENDYLRPYELLSGPVLKQSFFDYFYFAVWGRLYKRSFIEAHQLRFLPIKYEDVPFSTRVFFLAEQAIFTNKPLYHYRQRSHSIVEQPTHIDIVKAFRDAFTFIQSSREMNDVLMVSFYQSVWGNMLSYSLLKKMVMQPPTQINAYYEKVRHFILEINALYPLDILSTDPNMHKSIAGELLAVIQYDTFIHYLLVTSLEKREIDWEDNIGFLVKKVRRLPLPWHFLPRPLRWLIYIPLMVGYMIYKMGKFRFLGIK